MEQEQRQARLAKVTRVATACVVLIIVTSPSVHQLVAGPRMQYFGATMAKFSTAMVSLLANYNAVFCFHAAGGMLNILTCRVEPSCLSQKQRALPQCPSQPMARMEQDQGQSARRRKACLQRLPKPARRNLLRQRLRRCSERSKKSCGTLPVAKPLNPLWKMLR